MPTSAPRREPTAVWSLVLGILSCTCGGFITAIPAIICGHIGRSSIRKSGGLLGGMGMATAGLVLGYVALVLSLVIAISIPALLKIRQDARQQSSSGNNKEVVAPDGKSRLTVPQDWGALEELHKAAELQAGNKADEQFIIVISESKMDLDGMTLEKHHGITREAMLGKLKNPSASETEKVTINGQAALQDELGGTQEEEATNIVFLHTTVEDEANFHQILAWTTKSRWDSAKAQLYEVTRSFRSGK